MIQAAIKAIEYYLPECILTNRQLAEDFPEWTIEKIEDKTGIAERRIAGEKQCASDLSVEASRRLFASSASFPKEIDYILFCSQSSDYYLSATACIIQHRLDIPVTAGALDINLGCSVCYDPYCPQGCLA